MHDYHNPYHCHKCQRHYGFFNLLLDIMMLVFTGGFWIIWIIIREARHH